MHGEWAPYDADWLLNGFGTIRWLNISLQTLQMNVWFHTLFHIIGFPNCIWILLDKHLISIQYSAFALKFNGNKVFKKKKIIIRTIEDYTVFWAPFKFSGTINNWIYKLSLLAPCTFRVSNHIFNWYTKHGWRDENISVSYACGQIQIKYIILAHPFFHSPSLSVSVCPRCVLIKFILNIGLLINSSSHWQIADCFFFVRKSQINAHFNTNFILSSPHLLSLLLKIELKYLQGGNYKLWYHVVYPECSSFLLLFELQTIAAYFLFAVFIFFFF